MDAVISFFFFFFFFHFVQGDFLFDLSIPSSTPTSLAPFIGKVPLQSGGILSATFFLVSRSLMLNPLSAITESPSSSLSSRPLLSVMYLSLTFPVHSLETKEK